MRIPRRAVPIQPLTYMWERHKEIARLQVTGMKPIEIAAKLGMTPCRVSIIMNSPVYREYLETLSSSRNESAFDMKKTLEEGAEKGALKLVSYLEERDDVVPPKLKAQIAQDLLDRTGFGKSSTVNNKTLVVHCTESKIEELKRKQRELLLGLTPVEVVNE